LFVPGLRRGQPLSDILDGEDDGDDVGEDFALDAPAAPVKRGTRKVKAIASSAPAEVVSYTHGDQRVDVPEVGLVRSENDPGQPKTVWKYDTHLDPALQFDIGRAAVETLIDTALASVEVDTMRAALAVLKRLGQPYLTSA
jgi:adenine-specific DNA-methyltransferase